MWIEKWKKEYLKEVEHREWNKEYLKDGAVQKNERKRSKKLKKMLNKFSLIVKFHELLINININ